jgi:hypothetical protein
MASKFWKMAVISACVVGLLMIGYLLNPAPDGQSSKGEAPFYLIRPAFAQSTSKSFLEEEAGISLHVKLEQEIDLGQARDLYEVLEDETDSYLIGTVELPGHDRTFWPHVWVHKDGWIVVYYNKVEPTSKLMHWPTYTEEPPSTSTLREVLFIVGRTVRADTGQIEQDMRYYHWQHPDANKLLMVSGTGSFRYTLPRELTILDAAASHHAEGATSGYGSREWTRTRIDGKDFIKGGKGTYTLTKDLESTHLTAGTAHEVSVERGSGSAHVALFFLYR